LLGGRNTLKIFPEIQCLTDPHKYESYFLLTAPEVTLMAVSSTLRNLCLQAAPIEPGNF